MQVSACDRWIPHKVPLEGLCVSRAAPILPVFALRGASGIAGDQRGSLLKFNEQTEEMVAGNRSLQVFPWVRGGVAAPSSSGEKTAFLWDWCVQQSPWGPACVCGTDLALSCPVAPWQPRAPEAEHVSLHLLWRRLAGGSRSHLMGWLKAALDL